jgi:hypothetical protein
MTYREDMSAEELAAFKRELDQLHEAYTSAAEFDDKNAQPIPEEWEDEMETLRHAALDSRGRP